MQLYIMMGILLHLLSKGKTTAKNLSQKFEVSPRSIYRYIDSLSINGVPVICASGRNGGIYIDPNYTLSNLYFTSQSQNNPLFTKLYP